MKIVGFMVLAVLSAACSNITFDGLQFDRYVSVYEKAGQMQTQCTEAGTKPSFRVEVKQLQEMTSHMSTYADFRSNSPEVKIAAGKIALMVSELSHKYENGQPNVGYCQEKLANIRDGAKVISSTLGAQ